MSEQLQAIAEEARQQFERKTRTSGEEFWARKDGSPEWLADLCQDAHGDMLPDDWRYRFIVEALDALAEYEDADEARDSLEADIYTHDLTAWLGSNVQRPGYVDEAVEEFGVSEGGILNSIQWGQLAEKWEVFDSVRDSLANVKQEA